MKMGWDGMREREQRDERRLGANRGERGERNRGWKRGERASREMREGARERRENECRSRGRGVGQAGHGGLCSHNKKGRERGDQERVRAPMGQRERVGRGEKEREGGS